MSPLFGMRAREGDSEGVFNRGETENAVTPFVVTLYNVGVREGLIFFFLAVVELHASVQVTRVHDPLDSNKVTPTLVCLQ